MIMKKITIKAFLAGFFALGLVSCSDELNITSIDPQSDASYDATQLLAKQYATLGLTGQTGPSGNGDTSGDEGEIGFYRVVFNLEELCTDEVAWAWQTDDDIPALTYIRWTSSSTRAYWAYQRLAYNITLYNSYLSEMSDSGDPQYLAEVRFLRALNYYYFLDLFRKAPFKDTFSISELPVEKAGVDLYNWIDEELTDIESSLAGVGEFCNSTNFGRADRGAAYALHARLALNSSVYTEGTVQDYQKAIDYCDKIINSGAYELSTATKNGYSGYEQVFMGDNDENSQAMKEIIFPIRQDGTKTESYAGSTYLVASCRIAGMPYCNTTNYWSCNFARYSMVQKFFDDPESQCPIATEAAPSGATEAETIALDEAAGTSTTDVIAAAGDDRALFYTGCGGGVRSFTTSQITSFINGLSIVKWSNVHSDGGARHDDTFMDTDIPLFRLGEIYMTRAEAYYRLGQISNAWSDLMVIRNRANASTITESDVTEDFLIDEWCRECYMEARRRSDLVRFGRFSGSTYIWPFKGGVAAGTGVESYYDIYPIPADDIALNPNMTQNPGY